MKLLANWRDSWKWISTQSLITVGAINAVAVAATPFTPYAMKVVAGSSLVAAIIGAIGRVVEQGPPEVPAPPEDSPPEDY